MPDSVLNMLLASSFYNLQTTARNPKAYLGPCRTSTLKFFAKSRELFSQKAPSKLSDTVWMNFWNICFHLSFFKKFYSLFLLTCGSNNLCLSNWDAYWRESAYLRDSSYQLWIVIRVRPFVQNVSKRVNWKMLFMRKNNCKIETSYENI